MQNMRPPLSGIPVGRGSWTIEIGDDSFSASAQGGTAGLLKAFAGWQAATGASQGPRRQMARWWRSAYTATTTTRKKSENHPAGAHQRQRQGISIEPEPPVDADRIPVNRRPSARTSTTR